jgi:hypothetical protein
MTILWEFDEKHPKEVSAYGRSPTKVLYVQLKKLSITAVGVQSPPLVEAFEKIIFGPCTLRRTLIG